MPVDDFDRLATPVDPPYNPAENEYGHNTFLHEKDNYFFGYTFTDCIDFFDGTPEADFLSNFHPSPMVLPLHLAMRLVHQDVVLGLSNAEKFDLLQRTWPDGETVFQAFKMTNHTDFVRVAESSNPGQAKSRGRSYKMRRDWQDIRVEVMRMVLLAKFAPNTELAARLLATGMAVLIEGTTWGDRIWGVYRGEGQNLLGVLLMEQRGYLRAIQ